MVQPFRCSRQILVIAFCLAVLLLLPANAKGPGGEVPKRKGRWIRVETANFTLYSNDSRDETIMIGRHLEHLRNALQEISSGLKLRSPLPTKIYVFKNRAWFEHYVGRGTEEAMRTVGYFIRTALGNYVVIDASDKDDTLKIIYHEYLHYVMSNSVRGIPHWLGEGLAEFFSTFQVVGSRVEIGREIPYHIFILQQEGLMPLDELFDFDLDSNDIGAEDSKAVLYSQSWLLVHYLLAGNPEYRLRLNEYLTRLLHGKDSLEAFEKSFGTDLSSMDRELAEYIRSGEFDYYTYRPTEEVDKLPATVEPLEYDELLLNLGELLTARSPVQFEKASAHLTKALELDETMPEAYLALARLELKKENPEAAAALCRQALDLAPDDARVYALYGRSFLDQELYRGEGEDEDDTKVSPLMLEARKMLRKSLELAPDSPSALSDLGYTYIFASDEDVSEGVQALARASQIVPSNTECLCDLIYLTARSGNLEGARRLTDRALRTRGDTEQIRKAERSLAYFGLKSAMTTLDAGDYDEGEMQLRQALSDATDPAVKRELLSWIFYLIDNNISQDDRGHYERALASASEGDRTAAADEMAELAATTVDPKLRIYARIQNDLLLEMTDSSLDECDF